MEILYNNLGTVMGALTGLTFVWIYHIIRNHLNTSKYDMVENLLNDYWSSLDKEEHVIAIIRYEAYKNKVFKQFNMYEFEYNKYIKNKYRQDHEQHH